MKKDIKEAEGGKLTEKEDKKRKQDAELSVESTEKKKSKKSKRNKLKHESDVSLGISKVMDDFIQEGGGDSSDGKVAEEKIDIETSSVDNIKKKKKKTSDKKQAIDDGKVDDKQAETAALDYLNKWKCDRESWNFQKVRQVWLLKNIYSCDKISDDNFSILLEYLEGLKGYSRTLTVQQAQTIIDSMESDDEDEKKEKSQVTEEQSSRARQILQLLVE